MWTPVSQVNIYGESWQCVASNSDASVLIAGVNGGEIWINTQGTWINVVTEYFPTNNFIENKPWTGVASNFSGDMLYACADDLYYSKDSGISWSFANIPNVWTSIACDSSGQKVYACAGDIWTSSTGGLTWQNLTSGNPRMSGKLWQSVDCDADGQTIIACIKGESIWMSYDAGLNWTEIGIVYQNWISVAINAPGTFFVACVSGGYIWKSFGDGYWQSVNILQNWRSITMDASGQNVFACASDIWSSSNYGNTWSNTGMSYKNWKSIASDVTGQKLIACEDTIWLNQPSPGPTGPTGSTGPPFIDICFVKDSLVQTDQGQVAIQNLRPGKHTLFKQYILAVTETIHTDAQLVKVAAYAFGSYPTKDTYVSKNHRINGTDSFKEAQEFVNGVTVTLVPYDRQPLYNVLCERPAFMKVHGMMAETLDPTSDIALYHKSKRYRRL